LEPLPQMVRSLLDPFQLGVLVELPRRGEFIIVELQLLFVVSKGSFCRLFCLSVICDIRISLLSFVEAQPRRGRTAD